MKSLAPAALTNYAAPERTIATCWKVTRRDLEVFGFTDHDQSILYGGLIYEAFSGFTASQLVTNAQLSVDNMEVTGLFDSSGIVEAEIEAGVWDEFSYEIFEINYVTRAWINPLTSGWVGQFRRDKGLFVAELRSLTAPLQKTVGAMITPNCRYKLGDLNCKVDLTLFTEYDVPVTAVTTRRVFVASSLGSTSPNYPTDWFNWGVVTFTTGLNAGFSMDIKSYTAGGTVELQLPFPYAISVADEFTISPGCNKQLKVSEGVYTGDCKDKFDNVINNGSEPEVPLPSKTFRLPGT